MTHDSNAPATLAQIKDLLQSELHIALQPIKDQLQKLAGTVESNTQSIRSINGTIDRVLTVLVNVDKRLSSDVQHHDKRLKRLEKKAGLAPLTA